MEKEGRLEKGEARITVYREIKKHPNGITKLDILKNTGLKKSTIHSCIDALEKQNFVRKFTPEGVKKSDGKTPIVVLPITSRTIADKEELHFLIETYDDSISNNDTDKLYLILRDIEDICKCREVKDDFFLEFLVEKIKKEDARLYKVESGRDKYPLETFLSCIEHILINLRETIDVKDSHLLFDEKNLLKIIDKAFAPLTKIILKNKLSSPIISKALSVLCLFDNLEKYKVPFELLKNIDNIQDLNEPEPCSLENFPKDITEDDRSALLSNIVRFNRMKDRIDYKPHTELDMIYPAIEDMIVNYSKIDHISCREELYKLLTPDYNSIRHEVIGLLDRTKFAPMEPADRTGKSSTDPSYHDYSKEIVEVLRQISTTLDKKVIHSKKIVKMVTSLLDRIDGKETIGISGDKA